jgi:predicted Zn-dependent protease
MWLLPGLGAAGWLSGCAVDPVTGKKTMAFASKEDEIAVDKKHSPHQYSEDYGVSQDRNLNAYLASVGSQLSSRSHRPDMPFNFQVVNANYVNAYAFPGGSIACTRGILLDLDSEDELAALLGHETGHVNARHYAESQAKGTLVQLASVGLSVAAASQGAQYGELAKILGQFGGGALLSHYSRENEREADSLGMEYMVRGGYNPQGMVGLMEMLNTQHQSKPNALELMFATHPMSSERLATANSRMQNTPTYAQAAKQTLKRERYMDNTARVRALKPVINGEQKGEALLNQKQYEQAAGLFGQSLSMAPDDYPGLILMGKTQLAMKRPQEAQPYLDKAKSIYPTEAQAHHLSGVSHLQMRRPDAALDGFQEYERLLPGNPNTVFLKGYSYEMMQNKRAAAQEYYRYAQLTQQQGSQAQYAVNRLKAWGVVR